MKNIDGYIRSSENNGAVLNTDNAKLKAYKIQKNKFKEISELKNLSHDVDHVTNQVKEIKNEVKEIKNMISLILQNLKG